MIRTMKILTVLSIFGIVFGLSAAVTIKETLLERLNKCSNLLDQGIKNATAHGFDYHESLYLTLLSKVAEGRILVGQLSDNATDDNAKEIMIGTVELNAYILDRLNDPSPAERLKASAISLVASMKGSDKPADHKKADDLFEEVLSTIRQEKIAADFRIGVPNMPFDAISKLTHQYALLERTLKGHNIPTFQDYYDLANRTRAFLASSDLTLAKSKEVQEHLEQFDALTLDMAHSWPISGKEKAETYLKLSQKHLIHQMALQELLNKVNEVKSVRDQLLEMVDNEFRRVNDTAAELRERSLNYNADRLISMLGYLVTIRHNVELLPVIVDQRTEADKRNNVQTIISFVENEIKNRAPEERIKSEALYCAAILTPANQTQANDLKSKVKVIIEKENALLGPVHTVKDRMDKLTFDPVLRNLNSALEELTSGLCSLIPSPEDNFRDEKLAQKKAEELRKNHADELAKELEEELTGFQNLNTLMNRILPIDSEIKAQQWFVIAQSHHTSSKRILGKLN